MIGKAGRLGVGIIGMGHVGPVIGSALRAAGHSIVGVSAHSPTSVERAEDMLPGVPILPVPDLVERSEVVVLAIPDDEIAGLVEGLAALGAWQMGQLVIHLSGAHGTAVLEAAARCGAITLAIHPAMTFTGTSIDVARLVGTPFAVTAAPMVMPIAQALVVEMGGEPVEVAEEDRIAYHCALSHGANFLSTIVVQSLSILRAAGVENPSALAGPLLSAALDRSLRDGVAAISGPIPRGDAGTIAKHVRALGALSAAADTSVTPPASDSALLPATADTYASMTRHTVEILRDTGRLSQAAATEILAALSPID